MSVSADYLAYVLDQLAGLQRVRSRRMFGGVGLYADDVFFALIDNDTLYFKVDDENRSDYTARGCAPFRPFPNDPTYSMSYFEAPTDVLEDPDELQIWARKAVAAAISNSARPARKSGIGRSASKPVRKRAGAKRARE